MLTVAAENVFVMA